MQQVWKCDFCSTTGASEVVEKHEQSCFLNPRTKSCYTCNNRNEEGSHLFGFYNECKAGLSCNKVEDEEEPCNSWVIEVKHMKKKVANF
jgi:hypothetical protein